MIDRATNETHQKYMYFSNIKNSIFNKDKIFQASFAKTSVLENHSGVVLISKNPFVIINPAAIFGNAYKSLCSFFITMAYDLSKKYCNNLFHV